MQLKKRYIAINEKIYAFSFLTSEKIQTAIPEFLMSEKVKECELCEEEAAVLLCPECCKCYCDRCSEFVHKRESKRGHTEEPIPEGVRVDARCPLHKDNPLEMFCVDETRLLCGLCALEGLHRCHRIVKISDVTEMPSTNEIRTRFTNALKSCTRLKEKVDTTIETIQEDSVAIKERVTESFREAHEKLNAEETRVLNEIEHACNIAEGSLQNALVALKEAHEYGVLLNEASAKPRSQRSKILELSIASEMKKQIQLMEELGKWTMAGLRMEWDCDSMEISFTKPLINGEPVPYDVKFTDVACTGMNVSWECDGAVGMGLKFVVEMKEFASDDWEAVYSGKDKRCAVSGLGMDTEYSVRVKCVSKDFRGRWSDVTSVRTKRPEIEMSSVILSNERNGTTLWNKLAEWCGTDCLELLYRGTRDGFDASDFHWKCDGQGKTLVLVKNASGHVFGGFASMPWRRPSFGVNKRAPGSFLFTLTNMYGTQPTRFPLKSERDGSAVHHEIMYGPVFGDCSDLVIESDCNANTGSFTNFPSSYKDSTWKGSSIFSSDTETNHFQVQEIEVFRIIS